MANNPLIWDITLVDDDDKWYTIENVELLNDFINVDDLTLIEQPNKEFNNIRKLLDDIIENGECNYSKDKVLEIIKILE